MEKQGEIKDGLTPPEEDEVIAVPTFRTNLRTGFHEASIPQEKEAEDAADTLEDHATKRLSDGVQENLQD